MAQVKITGNTYPVKDKLKALGAKWDAEGKCWTIASAKIEAANSIVSAAPPQVAAMPGKCRDCGAPCKAPYSICWDCKSKRDLRSGVCCKCHGPLSFWERQHGVSRCSDCRDGGGNAHNGQSYYDRHGNFVLGDDD